MDNKKWSKRFSTLFWWGFGLLPLIVALIQFVGYHLTFNSGISTAQELATYHNDLIGNFYNILEDNYTNFNNWNTPFITNAWDSLLTFFNLEDSSLLSLFMSWLTFSFFLHVIFDVITWLPKWLHCVLHKYDL